MTPPKSIRELTDFPSLEALATALWKGGDKRHGAAVLVGAGFSRSATLASADTPPPPLWTHLCKVFAERLYPDDPTKAPTDALRIAEEYRAFFGSAALSAAIRSQMHDAAWYPSDNHQRLLELPWADVLTTNWDTLLERAAGGVTQVAYSTVRFPSDLVQARAPRIVKLHGSIGTDDSFIVAEDDYRQYPSTHAAFVNLARQVLIENSLCLLGFSGDDPNFLQWSGWVRDHLEGTHQRIYLVGVLDLSQPKRRLLEQRGVIPVDLSPLVAELPAMERHDAASRKLLDYLKTAKPKQPYDWRPSPRHEFLTQPEIDRASEDPLAAASLVRKISKRWQEERKSYPGWLICPSQVRSHLRYNVGLEMRHVEAAMPHLSTAELGRAVYELAWRQDISLLPHQKQELSLMEKVATAPDRGDLTTTELCFVLNCLLVHAREADDEAGFARWRSALKEHCAEGSDEHAALIYQQCLRLRDLMDFGELDKWLPQLNGPDPVWKVRSALLACDLRRWRLAHDLLLDALSELRKREADARTSTWVRSRRAWVQWIIQGVGPSTEFKAFLDVEPSDFGQDAVWLCDPWREVDRFRHDVLNAQAQRSEDEATQFVPQFAAGSYREGSERWVGLEGASIDYTVRRWTEVVGIPIQLGYTNYFDKAGYAAVLEHGTSALWFSRLLRAVHAEEHALIDRHLGRLSVARMTADVARDLGDRSLTAVKYWQARCRADAGSGEKPMSTIEALRVHLALLYRMTPRMSEEKAIEAFRLASSLANDQATSHYWLMQAIDRLSQFSLEALGRKQRSLLTIEVLEFPLSTERGISDTNERWPNPVVALFGIQIDERPPRDSRWAKRIDELIEAVGKGSAARKEAALRLVYLCEQKLLTVEERERLADTLWKGVGSGPTDLPNETGLMPVAFLSLPAEPSLDIGQRVRKHVFSDLASHMTNFNRLGAAIQVSLVETPLRPESIEASRLLSEFLTKLADIKPFQQSIAGPDRSELRRRMGQVIGVSLLPAIRTEDVSASSALELIQLSRQADLVTIGFGFIHLLGKSEDLDRTIAKRIERGIAADDWREVHAFTDALRQWHCFRTAKGLPDIPSWLFEALLRSIRSPQKSGLLQSLYATRMICRQDPPVGFQKDAAEELSDLVQVLDYGLIEPLQRAAVSISKVRAEAALLCSDLMPFAEAAHADLLQRFLNEARVDPLPEVRLAAIEGQE